MDLFNSTILRFVRQSSFREIPIKTLEHWICRSLLNECWRHSRLLATESINDLTSNWIRAGRVVHFDRSFREIHSNQRSSTSRIFTRIKQIEIRRFSFVFSSIQVCPLDSRNIVQLLVLWLFGGIGVWQKPRRTNFLQTSVNFPLSSFWFAGWQNLQLV